MKPIRLSLFLLLFIQHLFSSDIENPLPDIFNDGAYSNLIDFNTSPSAIVGGAVNVITGHYIENNTDLVGLGVNPITINRSFSSSLSEVGELYGYWDLNISGSVQVNKGDWGKYAIVKDRGMTVPYKGSSNTKSLRVDSDIFSKSIVNIPSPYISGRTNLRHKSLTINEKYNCYSDLGTDVQEYLYNHNSGKYYLNKVLYPNGTHHKYLYSGTRVNKIQSFTKFGTITGHVDIKREEINQELRRVSLMADDGRIIIYALVNPRIGSNNCHTLHTVYSNFSPNVRYLYDMKFKKDKKPLIAKHYPEGRFLGVQYNKDKVSRLTGPVGIGGEEAPLYRFEIKKGKRQTLVTNARNYKKKYYWNHQDRLKKIVEYMADSHEQAKDGGIYRTERLDYYGSFLQSRCLYAENGDLLLEKHFEYDVSSNKYPSKGNILSEYISGNLSGYAEDPSAEKYYKHYKYNDTNYVIQEDVGFQILDYTYYPESSNIQLKTVSNPNGEIQQRYYYEYNSSGTVILTIIDDGSTTEINDLSDVTQRLIKRVVTTTTKPWGLPEEVSEYYLDLTSGSEVLIRRIVNTFSRRGLLAREETYDCNNNFAYAKEWKHNSYGLVIETTDEAKNQTIYKYDANGNCIFKQTPNLNYHTEYKYNHMNLLIKEIEVHLDGNRFAKSYHYDRCGNMTRSYDYWGSKT